MRETGYPIEFRTAYLLEKAGFRCLRGIYVTDYDTNAALEVDVVATAFGRSSDGTETAVQFCIECKHIKEEAPWAFFEGGHNIEPHVRLQTATATELGEIALFQLAGSAEYRSSVESSLIFGNRAVSAYGGKTKATEDGTKKQDALYGALSAVVHRATLLGSRDTAHRACVTIPLVVTDGNMYIVSYSGEIDEMDIVPSTSLRVDWNGTTRKAAFGLDVMDLSYLSSTSNALFQSAQTLANDIAKALDILAVAKDGPNLRAHLETIQTNTPFRWPALADAWLLRSEGGNL